MSALAPVPPPASQPDLGAAFPAALAPEPGAETFCGWTMRARVLGDRVVAKATCPATGRVLSSGPQPTRAHAFDALRALIAQALDCE